MQKSRCICNNAFEAHVFVPSRCGGVPEQRGGVGDPHGPEAADVQQLPEQLQLLREEREAQRQHHAQLPPEERLRDQPDAFHKLHLLLQGASSRSPCEVLYSSHELAPRSSGHGDCFGKLINSNPRIVNLSTFGLLNHSLLGSAIFNLRRNTNKYRLDISCCSLCMRL